VESLRKFGAVLLMAFGALSIIAALKNLVAGEEVDAK
jgi:hypothetical protein